MPLAREGFNLPLEVNHESGINGWGRKFVTPPILIIRKEKLGIHLIGRVEFVTDNLVAPLRRRNRERDGRVQLGAAVRPEKDFFAITCRSVRIGLMDEPVVTQTLAEYRVREGRMEGHLGDLAHFPGKCFIQWIADVECDTVVTVCRTGELVLTGQ